MRKIVRAAALLSASLAAAAAGGNPALADGTTHVAPTGADTPCVSAPASCGFPDAQSTGVPAGTVLVPSGSVKVTKPGTLLSGLDISGTLVIAASDVTVRDVRVSCLADCDAKMVVRIGGNVTGVVIEDTEIVGSAAVHTGIAGGTFTARRVNVHDVNDGVHLQSGAVLEDSYIHNLAPMPPVHGDTVQIIDANAKNVTIEHNSLLPFDAATGVYNNSAIICGSQCTSTTDLSVENNLLDGGSQTLKCPDTGIANNAYQGNVFGQDFRFAAVNGACGRPGNAFTDNTFDGSGAPVVPNAK